MAWSLQLVRLSFFQEEIRKLYGQLQQMKTANMEAGNRHLGRSCSILFGGSTPSLLSSSTPNNNCSTVCLVNSGKERRQQRYSAAAELVSDFVWRTIAWSTSWRNIQQLLFHDPARVGYEIIDSQRSWLPIIPYPTSASGIPVLLKTIMEVLLDLADFAL